MANTTKKSVFEVLSAINVNEHTETKNGLTYLSWAWAWNEVKKHFPDANYTIYETDAGCFYHTDGSTCWVKTGVTIEGIEHVEYLPVMDFRNKSISTQAVTSFDVNKAIQRALTKACARHGLGLYIYAGEDLPEGEAKTEAKPKTQSKPGELVCDSCGMPITDHGKNTAQQIASASKKMFGQMMCFECAHNETEARKKAQAEAQAQASEASDGLPFPIDN